MPRTPDQLSPAAAAFLAERHLAALTTRRPDATPHVTPVGFTWDAPAGLARVICGAERRTYGSIRERAGTFDANSTSTTRRRGVST